MCHSKVCIQYVYLHNIGNIIKAPLNDWPIRPLIKNAAIELQTIIHFDVANFAKIMSKTLNFIASLAELIVNTSIRCDAMRYDAYETMK